MHEPSTNQQYIYYEDNAMSMWNARSAHTLSMSDDEQQYQRAPSKIITKPGNKLSQPPKHHSNQKLFDEGGNMRASLTKGVRVDNKVYKTV